MISCEHQNQTSLIAINNIYFSMNTLFFIAFHSHKLHFSRMSSKWDNRSILLCLEMALLSAPDFVYFPSCLANEIAKFYFVT